MWRIIIRIAPIPLLATALLGLLWFICVHATALAQTTTTPMPRSPAISIVLTKTVGTDPDVCATTHVITVAAGAPFYYCYTVQNTGAITLVTHTIKDTQYISPLKNNAVYALTPGAPPGSITSFTVTVSGVQQTTVSTGTWIAATTDGYTTTDHDATKVLVPVVEVKATVGTQSGNCASTKQINVMPGAKVTFCYTVHNPGKVTLRLHSIKDSQGAIAKENWVKVLPPGSTAYTTTTTTINQTTQNMVTWTGYVTGANGIAAVATDIAIVNTPAISLNVTVGTEPGKCATTPQITVATGTQVYYCYAVINTGGVTFTRHEIDDSLTLAPYARPYILPPNSAYGIGTTAPVTQTNVNSVTWTAYDAGGLSAISRGAATVTVVYSVPVFVFYDVNVNGQPDRLERGMPNLEVRLKQTDQVLTETTGINGKVVFTNVHAGAYTVTVDEKSLPPGFTLTTNQNVFTTELQASLPEIKIGYTSPPNYNSDCDGIPDRLEGPGDSNNNGIPDYLDANCIYLPAVRR